MLKHFSWSGRGRVGVKLDNDYLEVFQVSGEALPAHLLLKLLQVALSPDDMERADILNYYRHHPIVVEHFQGMSGAENFILRSLTDREKGIIKRCAVLHISMNDKLNQGLSCWLGDLPPLLFAASLLMTDVDFEEVEIKIDLKWEHPCNAGSWPKLKEILNNPVKQCKI